MSKPTAAGERIEVVDPRVTTDRSVDCSTVEAILKGLIREGMTDEEKVLAVFNWTRRTIYHGDGRRKDLAYNFHHIVNVSGHGSCLRQTTVAWVLLDRLGYKCETWARNGHHLMQVNWGGRWHCLDPHMTFYVYNREKPPAIASAQELQDDPSLALEAVKEGRACPGFLLCGDGADTFAGKGGWQNSGPFPEGRHSPTIAEPFGRIALRRGESYTRTWMPGPHWYRADHPSGPEAKTGPFHGCRRRDMKDTVNWPLYEPHGWEVGGSVTYRHWGAGRLVYRPDLATDHWRDALVEGRNLTSGAGPGGGALRGGKSGEPAAAVFSVNCPYAITAGELRLRAQGEGRPEAAVSTDRGASWKQLDLVAGQDGTLGASFVDEVQGALDGYRLRLTVPAKGGLSGLELVSHFQLNPYALPYLVPGKNAVTVDAGRFGAPLSVAWRWSEGEGWKTPRSLERTVTKRETFEVDVAGPKYPRMESLTLELAP